MRPYAAIFRARWQALLTYRAAALAGFLTQLFWGGIRIMILEAFYREAPPGGVPIPIDHVRTYIWLSQATIMILGFNVDGELAALVRSGGIATELLRPVGLFGNWYARSVALRTAPTLLRAVPLLVIAWLAGGLALPPGAAQAWCWAASTVASVLLSAALTTVLSMTLLWNLAGEGVRWLVNPCVWVLSGLLMPLPLFPDRLQWLIRALPFRGMMDVPCRIWSGDIPPAAAVVEIGGQLAWAAALAWLGVVVARRGVRRLVIAGG